MTGKEIKALQNIIMGYSFQESIIEKALLLADTLEVKIILKALKSGHGFNLHGRMAVQDFVCRLSL